MEEKKCSKPLSEGEVVLTNNDNCKCIDWPLGRITKLISGRNSHIRLAHLKTEYGYLLRPSRLYSLECIETSESTYTEKTKESTSIKDVKDNVRMCSRDNTGVSKIKNDFNSRVPEPDSIVYTCTEVIVTRSRRMSGKAMRF